ncbi:MAG: aspartate/glutamate racemase family protein [Pseudomonadota bacterium]|nr:aspartate/glutamate racemase family protein [Pseudomonadota bacterium]
MSSVSSTQPAPAFAAAALKAQTTLDNGPGAHRIGLIALASDYVVERDFMNMRPSDEVAVFVSRVLNVNPCTVENLRTMGPRLADAASLIIPDGRLDAMVYCCTSGTAAMGYDTVAENIRSVRPGIPVITPITAGLRALSQFSAEQIAVLTPYTDDVNASLVDYIQEYGPRVSATTSFHFANDNDMARIPPEAIVSAAKEADRDDADALFISCTAIRAVDVINEIEQALGKPVVSANQALFWEAVRTAGYTVPIEGYGRLLTMDLL